MRALFNTKGQGGRYLSRKTANGYGARETIAAPKSPVYFRASHNTPLGIINAHYALIAEAPLKVERDNTRGNSPAKKRGFGAPIDSPSAQALRQLTELRLK